MKPISRQFLLITIDILIIWLSVTTSYFLRLGWEITPDRIVQMIVYASVSSILCLWTFQYFKLYKRLWEYASVNELLAIIKAVVIGCTISYFLMYLYGTERVPVSVYLRVLETTIILVGGSRFGWRIVRSRLFSKLNSERKALIIGAGDCGMLVAKELLASADATTLPIAFIDDSPLKKKHHIFDLPVIGGRSVIKEYVAKESITDIIIAIPSANKSIISELVEIAKDTPARLRIVPKINDFIQGNAVLQEIRDVQVEDLLGRDPVEVDLDGIANYVTNKVVLVTGAGGSIGSELSRQVASFAPKQLLLLGHGENSIYIIQMALRQEFPGTEIIPIIADVQDEKRIDEVFKSYRPQVIFHAAAHKHVPLMELNPAEAIKNNVFGTRNVAIAADKYKAERFVLISTDKAVNPTSVMGTTKQIAERIVQCIGQSSQTKFVAVRFGNVLGSRGSVIPRFKEQIASGGPVTVTHPDMIRYFMTIPEAVQLVIQAGAFANGGEVFVLDMGKPVKILQLAEDLIRLSGFTPYKDIAIEFTGIRQGEKLYEELLTEEEGIQKTTHDRIFIGKSSMLDVMQLNQDLGVLRQAIDKENFEVRKDLKMIVPTYVG
jgi:FlaA1/EpsC-like NDP-sugar epimerase